MVKLNLFVGCKDSSTHILTNVLHSINWKKDKNHMIKPVGWENSLNKLGIEGTQKSEKKVLFAQLSNSLQPHGL